MVIICSYNSCAIHNHFFLTKQLQLFTGHFDLVLTKIRYISRVKLIQIPFRGQQLNGICNENTEMEIVDDRWQ